MTATWHAPTGQAVCTCGIPMQHTASCPAHRRDACPFCALPGMVPVSGTDRPKSDGEGSAGIPVTLGSAQGNSEGTERDA